MATIREIKQSPQPQGVNEIVAYTLDTTPWGGPPDALSSAVKVIDITKGGWRVVTPTVMPGSSSEAGAIITTPALKLITAGRDYRVEIQWTLLGNTLEAFGIVNAEL